MKRRLLCALPIVVLFAPAATAASTPPPAGDTGLTPHASNAPINVSSDAFEGNFQTKIGTYSGNVIITQAGNKLRADTVKVEVLAGKPNRFQATGHVVLVSSSGTATGDTGIYELGPRTVTLTGHVVLTKDKDVMRGTSLVVNMNTGESHLTAHGAPGDRVQGLFVQQPKSSKSANKPDDGVRQ
jgi:lipopolysaccharide export system protein LptA